jgi:hypothetical protein
VIEPDEVVTVVAYASAIGPALRCAGGSTAQGSLGVITHDPEAQLTVDIGSEVSVRPGVDVDAIATIEGDAVELAEALSQRVPTADIALADEHRWMLAGLDEIFGS